MHARGLQRQPARRNHSRHKKAGRVGARGGEAGVSQRVMAWLGLVALLVYAGWIGGPYLQSIILRDAAVTTWINIATAPIAGFVEANPLLPGARVSADGRL